jgi:pyruvate-formate lyase-activating enzyme
MTEHLKRKLGDLLVTATAMSAVAHALMHRLMPGYDDEADLDALRDVIARKLKNADIEGLDYDQQTKLISRSIESADAFLEIYKTKIRQTNNS